MDMPSLGSMLLDGWKPERDDYNVEQNVTNQDFSVETHCVLSLKFKIFVSIRFTLTLVGFVATQIFNRSGFVPHWLRPRVPGNERQVPAGNTVHPRPPQFFGAQNRTSPVRQAVSTVQMRSPEIGRG